MHISRNQIETLIIGALILAFLVYNFSGFNITLGDNGSTAPAANISTNNPNVNATPKTNISINAHSAYGISFNYPSTWSLYEDNSVGDEMIIVSKDDSTKFQVQITSNNGMSEQEVIDSMKNTINIFGWWNKISNSTLTIDNKTAYKDTFIVYNIIPPIMGDRFEQICLVKNDKTYLMLLQAKNEDFDKEKPNFDVILNSFKVQ